MTDFKNIVSLFRRRFVKLNDVEKIYTSKLFRYFNTLKLSAVYW